MKIVADQNMPLVQELFAPYGQVHLLPGREITAADVTDADVLLVRSVTEVNRQLLENSKVKFVGSATIGTDHIDTDYLQSANITFAHAPGCNAEAVVQYDLSVMCRLVPDWQSKTVGIVGCGNVGGRLYKKLLDIGVSCFVYDPFLAADSNADIVSFDELISSSDIICLHTPITKVGAFPTHHMFNSEVLSKIKPGALLLNAGRGAVIDNKALLAHLRADAPLQVALDVWEPEPQLDLNLMALVEMATPHIAGYSLEGKTNGTQMVFDAFLTFLGEKSEPCNEPTDEFQVLGNLDTLDEAVLASYDVAKDDQRMRDTLANLTGPEAVGLAFDQLRKTYPVRREFSYYSVSTEDSNAKLLGFRT